MKLINCLKLGSLALLFSLSCISFSSAEGLQIDLNGKVNPFMIKNTNIASGMTQIHYVDNGNSFGGFIYFSDLNTSSDISDSTIFGADGLTGYEVSGTSGVVYCQRNLKGWYYDSQRGDRIWPLDNDTMGSFGYDGDLTISGGFYTDCYDEQYFLEMSGCNTKEDVDACQHDVRNSYSLMTDVYGEIIYTYKGKTFTLVAGTDYKKENSWWMYNTKLHIPSTFQMYINGSERLPLGLVFDSNGGVGFVGCQINSDYSNVLAQLIKYATSSSGIVNSFSVDGSGNLYCLDSDVNAKLTCGNSTLKNTFLGLLIEGLIGWSSDSEKSGVRGTEASEKMQLFSSVNINDAELINDVKKKAEDLCRGKRVTSTSLCNSLSSSICCYSGNNTLNASAGKTYVVRGGDVNIEPLSSTGSNYYDIFVDGGSLKIKDVEGMETVIDNTGFPNSHDVDTFYDCVEQYTISGSLYGGCQDYSGDVAVANVLRGNIIVNGTITGSMSNKYFIYGKFTSLDDFSSLRDKFKWTCVGGVVQGTESEYCPGSFVGGNNRYQYAALAVIDYNYESPLYWSR